MALLSLVSAAGGHAAAGGRWEMAALAAAAAVLFAARAVRAYRSAQRKVSFMFDSIDCDDYAFRFADTAAGRGDRMLNASLNRIKDIMSNAKSRAAEREKYYQLILEGIGTGVITLDAAGHVLQANGEALRLLGAPLLTHVAQLARVDAALPTALAALREGERRQISFATERGQMRITAIAAGFRREGKDLKIISLNNISPELDANEVESWTRLTRVLTHEIMNSLAPITSLSDSLLRLDAPCPPDIAAGLATIRDTAAGLRTFVESYRRFAHLGTPRMEPFGLLELAESRARLACPPGIELRLDIDPPDTLVYADPAMVAMALLNLVANAAQALAATPGPRITVTGRIAADESVDVEVADNGPAIPPEVAAEIFTPFFTTKPGGSGIGLSVARQVMRLHGGSIRLAENVDGNVVFALKFR